MLCKFLWNMEYYDARAPYQSCEWEKNHIKKIIMWKCSLWWWIDGWIGCMRALVHLQKREFVSLFLSFITMLIILFVVRQFVVYRVRRIHRMRAHIYTTQHNTIPAKTFITIGHSIYTMVMYNANNAFLSIESSHVQIPP